MFIKWFCQFFRKKKPLVVIVKQSFFDNDLKKTFQQNNINQQFLEKLEHSLIKSDMGVVSTNIILEKISQEKIAKDSDFNDVVNLIKTSLKKKLSIYEKRINIESHKPYVIIFLGVNGSGKTTNLGKIAHKFKQDGKKVLIAACDTFRAGAGQQLDVWAKRANCDIFMSEKEGSDPASVAYQSFEKAKKENYDILLIDTAGRLQNQTNLMQQLSKINRVLKKLDENAPHTSLLVIDGTTGQNAAKQVEIFNHHINLDGLIITKLDGTAKGGVLVAITDKYKLPVYFVGNGEKIEDIEEFSVDEYLDNIFNIRI